MIAEAEKKQNKNILDSFLQMYDFRRLEMHCVVA